MSLLSVTATKAMCSKCRSEAGKDPTCSSWQDYIDKVFLDSGHVSRAGIYSIDDGICWAKSPNFSLKPEELDNIKDVFENSMEYRFKGLVISNRLFTITRINDNRIIVCRDSKTGYGCIIYKCHICIIIVLYEDGNHPGCCYTTVVKVGDYLLENNL